MTAAVSVNICWLAAGRKMKVNYEPFQTHENKEKSFRSVWKVRTQDSEKFVEEVKSLVTAWLFLALQLKA